MSTSVVLVFNLEGYVKLVVLLLHNWLYKRLHTVQMDLLRRMRMIKRKKMKKKTNTEEEEEVDGYDDD